MSLADRLFGFGVDAVRLTDRVHDLNASVDRLTERVHDLDKRLVRIETLIEYAARARERAIEKPGSD